MLLITPINSFFPDILVGWCPCRRAHVSLDFFAISCTLAQKLSLPGCTHTRSCAHTHAESALTSCHAHPTFWQLFA